MSKLECRECRKNFMGDRAFRGHRVKIKNPKPDGPKFRCMDDEEFSENGFTQINDYYVGGKAEVWF